MPYKTKKNNRRKKFKYIQRKQTKKHMYYGGEGPVIKEHNSETINNINANLASLDSKLGTVKSTVDDLNEKSASLKKSVSNGLGSVSGGMFNFFSNGLKNIVERIGENTLEQGGEAATLIMRAAKKPLEEAAGTFNKLGEDAAKNAAVGAVNVVTDVAAAVPGLGAMVEAGKIATDLATTASKSVKILEKAVDTAGDVMDKTQQNLEKNLNALQPPNIGLPMPNINGAIERKMGEGFNKLENMSNNALNAKLDITGDYKQPIVKGGGFNKMSKEKEQIGGRIIDSLDEFADPISYQTGILKGGTNNNNKTKKSFGTSNHGKTKHVRFSF